MEIEKIEKIEKSSSVATILVIFTLVFFQMIELLIALAIGVIVLKYWIYTQYRAEGVQQLFWQKTSKPAVVGLITLLLLVIFDYYGLFELVY